MIRVYMCVSECTHVYPHNFYLHAFLSVYRLHTRKGSAPVCAHVHVCDDRVGGGCLSEQDPTLKALSVS